MNNNEYKSKTEGEKMIYNVDALKKYKIDEELSPYKGEFFWI